MSWVIAFALAALVTGLLGGLGVWAQDDITSTTDAEIVVLVGVLTEGNHGAHARG